LYYRVQRSKAAAGAELQSLEQAVRATVSEFEIVCASLQTCAPVMFRRELSYFMTAAQRELNNNSSNSSSGSNAQQQQQQQYYPVPEAFAIDAAAAGGSSSGGSNAQDQHHYGSYAVHIGSVVHNGLANGFARASKVKITTINMKSIYSVVSCCLCLECAECELQYC
jgi:hypothetical protein